MTGKNISDALGKLDSAYIEETISFEGKKKRNMKRWTALAACISLLLLVGVSAITLLNRELKTSDGGEEGEDFSTVLATVIGTGFSEEEIQDYIQNNKDAISSVILMEYDFPIESISVYKKGYCHANCGEGNRVDLDAITLPVLVNGQICANITLMKVDGKLMDTLSFGGETWVNFNTILKDHPDTDIVFAYLPGAMGQIMILPDNTFMNPVVGQLERPVDPDHPQTDWYELLKTAFNTISYNELIRDENLVHIYSK